MFTAGQTQRIQIEVAGIAGVKYAAYTLNILKSSNDLVIPVSNTSPVQVISVYHDNICESVKLLVNP